jgi:signal peptidase I
MNIKSGIEKTKKATKKFWFLLWQDDSFKGWLFSIIFLFIFIKLILFPTLNLVTGTSLPLAIVESCSMYHQNNVFSDFDSWFDRHYSKYNQLDISKEEFENFILKRGFSKGDIVFIIKANPEKLKIGDIIAFSSGTKGTPVIHRIIKIKQVDGKKIFTTIGDNNAGILIPSNNLAGVDEREISEEQLVGKAVLRVVPWIGWGKLIFFEGFRPTSERGFCEEN